MNVLCRILVMIGFAILTVAAISRFFVGLPYSLFGVRALSLIALANTAFLLAILVKLTGKKP